MIEVRFKPGFIRQYKKLPKALREEVQEKIQMFRQDPRHPQLKIHKLGGSLEGALSFSVNYKFRIVYEWHQHDVAVLLAVGDHSVYE